MFRLNIIDNPFVWLKTLGWDDFADSCSQYSILDDIYRIIVDGYDERNVYDSRVLSMSIVEMKNYYKMHFPVAVGEFLVGLGESIKENPELLQIDFEKV